MPISINFQASTEEENSCTRRTPYKFSRLFLLHIYFTGILFFSTFVFVFIVFFFQKQHNPLEQCHFIKWLHVQSSKRFIRMRQALQVCLNYQPFFDYALR